MLTILCRRSDVCMCVKNVLLTSPSSSDEGTDGEAAHEENVNNPPLSLLPASAVCGGSKSLQTRYSPSGKHASHAAGLLRCLDPFREYDTMYPSK